MSKYELPAGFKTIANILLLIKFYSVREFIKVFSPCVKAGDPRPSNKLMIFLFIHKIIFIY